VLWSSPTDGTNLPLHSKPSYYLYIFSQFRVDVKALLHGAIFHANCPMQCFKKDVGNALQEVLHAAMIFMQLATIGDRGMRRD
jgi:hypothetical protein